MPESVTTGTLAVHFSNTGAELHEIALFRIDSTQSLEQVLASSDDAADEKKLKLVGSIDAAPGE